MCFQTFSNVNYSVVKIVLISHTVYTFPIVPYVQCNPPGHRYITTHPAVHFALSLHA